MRTFTLFLALVLATAVRASVVQAQLAQDICPLAVRMSSARPEAACLDARRLPLPPLPHDTLREGVQLLGARLLATERSAYPEDRNNGALWSGRGLSTAFSFGAAFRRGRLTVAFEPEVTWSQNENVLLPDTVVLGLSRYAYPWAYGRLDWYMRPGSGPVANVDAGESFAELRLGQVRFGVSNERFWWGPARRYPLLFSGTAPGFPHAYVGSAGYIHTPAGGVGFDLLWGRLTESHWFDANPSDNVSLLDAFQLRWRPGFVPGLELAYAIARHEPLPDGKLQPDQLIQIFTGDPSGENPARRGTPMGTVSIRFAYPNGGFEAYAQIGRGEGFLVPEPGVSLSRASQVYLMGFARTDTTASGRKWRISGEVMKEGLDLLQPVASGAVVDTVQAGAVFEGHTNEGQLLGPYVGPGSNAQYMAFDILGARRTWGVYVERVRFNDDTYFRTVYPVYNSLYYNYGFRGHDMEWTLGTRGGLLIESLPGWSSSGPLSLGADLGISRRKNRLFILLNNVNRAFVREWNLSADVYVRWRP